MQFIDTIATIKYYSERLLTSVVQFLLFVDYKQIKLAT